MACTRAKQDRMNLPSVLPWPRGTTQTGQRAARPMIRGGGTNQKRTTATSRRTVEQGRKSVYGYGRPLRVRVFIKRLLFPREVSVGALGIGVMDRDLHIYHDHLIAGPRDRDMFSSACRETYKFAGVSPRSICFSSMVLRPRRESSPSQRYTSGIMA